MPKEFVSTEGFTPRSCAYSVPKPSARQSISDHSRSTSPETVSWLSGCICLRLGEMWLSGFVECVRLKIRWGLPPVWVRLPPPAPFSTSYNVSVFANPPTRPRRFGGLQRHAEPRRPYSGKFRRRRRSSCNLPRPRRFYLAGILSSKALVLSCRFLAL